MRNNKPHSGFTIIEVLIVLAITGLIVLIVFLAVPALQRNQRNNTRHKDATRIAAAVNECLAHRHNVPSACDQGNEISPGDTYQLINITNVSAPQYQQDTANIWFSSDCNLAGTAVNANSNPRSFTVAYQLEPNVNRCVRSVF